MNLLTTKITRAQGKNLKLLLRNREQKPNLYKYRL